MGVSTDGLIFCGWVFEEGFEFPWENAEIEKWWREVNGYKPPFQIYDERGDYLGGKKPAEEKISEYYDHLHAWEKEHPIPVLLENYCSSDYPEYAIVVPGTVKTASRGYPQKISEESFKIDAQAVKEAEAFLQKYDIEHDGEPSWYLASYWG